MTFTPKDWQDDPDHTTPLNAAALVDLEERVTDYAETIEYPDGAVTAAKIGSLPSLIVPKVSQTTNSGDVEILTWGTEEVDTDALFDATSSATDAVCKTAGVYHVDAAIELGADVDGIRIMYVYKNGSATKLISGPYYGVDGINFFHTIGGSLKLAINDIVTIRYFQNAGNDLPCNVGQFSMHWTGKG